MNVPRLGSTVLLLGIKAVLWLMGILFVAVLLFGRAEAADIVVDKSERTLTHAGVTYDIIIGRNPVGHKQRQGDNRTPEGLYRLHKRTCAACDFKRAYVLNYPNRQDRKEGRTGGGILIHGAFPFQQWTAGCIALSQFDQLWAVVPDGATVEVKP